MDDASSRSIGNGKSAPRSRNGCWTCRRRHIKCDETRPVCNSCTKRKLECDYTSKSRSKKPLDRSFRKILPRPALSSSITSSHKRTLVTNIARDFQDVSLVSTRISSFSANNNPSSYCRKKQFLNFLENDAPSSEDPFFVNYWPLKVSVEDAKCLYNYCTNFDTASTKSYKYCFHAGMVLISSLSPMLARLTQALAQAHAGKNYTTAYNIAGLKEFLTLFNRVETDRDVVFVLVAIWLLVQYEHQYGSDTCALKSLFCRFKALMNGRAGVLFLPNKFSSGKTRNSVWIDDLYVSDAIISRLMLWIAYHDGIASTFGVGGDLISLAPQEYPSILDRLCSKSFDATQEIWQEVYPYDQLFDDALNHDILKLHYHSLIVRLLAADLQTKWLDNNVHDEQRAKEIEVYVANIMDEFSCVFKSSPPSTSHMGSGHLSDRYNANLNCLGAMFSSSRLLYLAVLSDIKQDDNCSLEHQMSECIQLVLKYAATIEAMEGIKPLYRIVFPLFICALESADMTHQSWVMMLLHQLAPHGNNAIKAQECLKSMRGRGWMEFVRSRHFRTFVL